MNIWLKRVIAWPVATFVCTALAAFMSSQRVLNQLPDPLGKIGLSERVSTAVYDIQHFGSLYGPFILITFLIAFLAGGLIIALQNSGGLLYLWWLAPSR